MAKLPRKLQKLFGSLAGANQLAKYGSLAAGSPVRYDGTTIDPDNIQALSNYLTGWFGAVLGSNSPSIEDMNSLFYLAFYQLAYIMQAGIPEWNSQTTYYAGSMVNSAGTIFVSLTDNNLNNPVTDPVNWSQKTITKFVLGSAAQVAAGIANYSTWASLLAAVSDDDYIVVLTNATWIENVTISKRLTIEGQGVGAFLNGTLTFASGSDKSKVRNIRIGDNVVINSGVSGIFLEDFDLVTGKTVTDNGPLGANWVLGYSE